jgi:hypothetical protein
MKGIIIALLASDAALLVGGKTKGTDACGLGQASILKPMWLFTFLSIVLQWHLSRIAALEGAGEGSDEDGDEDE